MASVSERPDEPKKHHRAPILFADWTGWLFWLVVLAVFAWWLQVLTTAPKPADLANVNAGPSLPKLIEYSALSSPVAVYAYRVRVSDLFPVSDLMRNARTCRQARTEEYFRTLLQTFAQAYGQVYSFRYLGEVSDNGILPVVVIPNLPHYQDLEALKKDFNVCGAGGRRPLEVTADWLMFMDDCPRSDIRAKGAAGCNLIRTELSKDRNLKLVK